MLGFDSLAVPVLYALTQLGCHHQLPEPISVSYVFTIIINKHALWLFMDQMVGSCSIKHYKAPPPPTPVWMVKNV